MTRPARDRRRTTPILTRSVQLLAGIAAIGSLLLLMAGPGVAGDWPQFKRDAARTGDAPDETLALPLKRTVAVRFPSPIYASAAVVAGRAYVQDAWGNLACIDVAGNKSLWVTPLGGRNNSSSPAVAGGKVYVGNDDGAFFVVDADTGKVLRKLDIPGGVVAAPAVTQDAVYFPSFDGMLYRTSLDGKLVWTFKGGWTSHQEIAVRGSRILFFSGPVQEKEGLGPVEKEVAWAVNMPNARLLVVRDEGDRTVAELAGSTGVATSGPVWFSDTKFAYQHFDSEASQLVIIDLATSRESKGAPVAVPGSAWQGIMSLRSDSRGVPAARDGFLYTGRACFLQDASRVVWYAAEPLRHCGSFHGGPSLAKDHQVVGGQDGRVYFTKIAGDGALASSLGTGEDKPAPTREPAWVYDTELVGTTRANAGIVSSPAIADKTVFVGCLDGTFLGLGPGEETAPVDVLPAAKVKQPGPPHRLPGGEWPTLGGDLGFSHVSTDTTVKPPFRIRWKTRVWGVFKAPVIVADGRVYATTRFGNLIALDADSGRILWSQFMPYGESYNPSSFIDGKVITSRSNGPNQGLWCYDAGAGVRLWRRAIRIEDQEQMQLPGVPVFGRQTLVCEQIKDTTLRITAIDIDTGKDQWVREIPDVLAKRNAGWFPMTWGAVAGDGRWYVSASVNASAEKDPKRPATAWGGDQSKMMAGRGITLALDPRDGAVLWEDREHIRHNRSGLKFRKGILAVFGAHGCSAHDPSTGAVLWTVPIERVANSPAYGSYQGQPLSNQLLDSKGMAGTFGIYTCSIPVWANGLVYGHRLPISNYSGVLDPATGKEVWHYRLPCHVCPTPTPAYGRLYVVGNGEGVVYCFEPDTSRTVGSPAG